MYSVNPAPQADRAGGHRLRPPRRGSVLRRPVLLRDARLPDLGRARPEVDEPAGPGARRRHGGAVAVRRTARTTASTSTRRSPRRSGSRLDKLVRSPLIKADLWKGLPEFNQWGASLKQLPSPALIHPVAFQSGGFDEAHPDFLPPDPRWGSSADLNGMAASARSLGQLVMPYLNVSWWDTTAPSVQALPSPLEPKDIAVQNLRGNPVTEQFGPHDGYIVSPHAAAVRKRIQGVFEEWKTDVPADCLFFDQIGARPWRRDFNPAAPSPLAYYDGWLSLFAPYAQRCVMAEDGWDRLAATFSGFHGGVLLMSHQFEWPNSKWGEGNWEPYPIAGRLFGDKVLMYQHDLYEPTMTINPETLLFNVAFGFVLSYAWDGEREEASLTNPWATLVGQVQRTLGPHYAGKRLTGVPERGAERDGVGVRGRLQRAGQLELAERGGGRRAAAGAARLPRAQGRGRARERSRLQLERRYLPRRRPLVWIRTAGVAQLVEQRPCKAWAVGSSPSSGSSARSSACSRSAHSSSTSSGRR